MRSARFTRSAALRRAVLLGLCVPALAACDVESLRGTKGLPPAPANIAYPAVGVTPPQRPGRLKTIEEQRQLEADLLARKPR
jgi:hypothetical protein